MHRRKCTEEEYVWEFKGGCALSEDNETSNDVLTNDYDTRTEGPSKPGVPETERAKNATDPRDPGYDKHLDGPVSPRV
jgi:hypothetical protein